MPSERAAKVKARSLPQRTQSCKVPRRAAGDNLDNPSIDRAPGVDIVAAPSGGRGGMADAADSKSVVREDVGVQVSPPAPEHYRRLVEKEPAPRGLIFGAPARNAPQRPAFQRNSQGRS